MHDALRSTPSTGCRSSVLCSFLVLSALVTAGCGTAYGCWHSWNAAVAAAPESAKVDGRAYTMTAYVWRDFQPIAPPDGRPLAVVVKVTTVDGKPILNDLSLDRVWVVNARQQWSAAPVALTNKRSQVPTPFPGELVPPTRLDATVHDGPKWGPSIKVDVVARLKLGKQTWLVRTKGVEVKRTD